MAFVHKGSHSLNTTDGPKPKSFESLELPPAYTSNLHI